MAEDLNQTFIANAIGGGGGSSDDIRKKLILAMLQEGTSSEPVGHWTQGLSRVAKAMLGGLELRDLDRLDREQMGLEREYLRQRFGVGGPSSMPGTAGVDSGPRPAGAPSLAVRPAPLPDEEPPPVPIANRLQPTPGSIYGGTGPTPGRGLPSPAPPAPLGPMAGDPGGPMPTRDPEQVAAAMTQMRQGFGQGFGVGQANSIVGAPTPDAAMALTPPAGPAGALPPQMAAPGPGAAPPPQRPLTPPAPLAAQAPQAGQPSDMTPEQREQAFRLFLSKRTSPAVKGLIQQDISPDWKFQVAGDKLYRVSGKTGRFEEVANAEKSPDAVRIADAMMANPQRFGYKSKDDPNLHEALQQRLSGLTTAEGAFGPAATRQLTERYGKLLEAGNKGREQAGNIQALRELSTTFSTGKEAEIKAALGPWAGLFGIDIKNLGSIQAYEAITQKMAADMYVPGTGAQSNFEMQGFLKQIPQLGKTPEGNALITRSLESLVEHRQKVADIAMRALTKELSPAQAEAMITKLPNPLQLWKDSRGQGGTTSAGGGGVGRTFNPATGKFE